MRYTQKNHDGKTYRIPAERLGEFRLLQIGGNIAVFGDIVDMLGRYESALTIKEAEAYACKK